MRPRGPNARTGGKGSSRSRRKVTISLRTLYANLRLSRAKTVRKAAVFKEEAAHEDVRIFIAPISLSE